MTDDATETHAEPSPRVVSEAESAPVAGGVAEVDADLYARLRTGAVLARPAQPAAVLRLTGDDAAEFLQGQVTNDVEALRPGTGAYAAMLTPKGQMRADMRVLNTGDGLLIVADAALMPVIRRTIDTFRIGYGFEVADVGDEFRIVSLVGPRSRELIGAALDAEAVPGERENDNVRVDHLLTVTTLLGVDIIGPSAAIDRARRALAKAGAAEGDPQVLELARIERGIPRFGAEMDERTMPEEAGITERAVSFEKGCYVGQETVARLHYKGKPNRHLRSLALSEPVPPGSPVVALDGRELGRLGSVAISPERGPVALAVLRREASPGDEVLVAGAKAAVAEAGF